MSRFSWPFPASPEPRLTLAPASPELSEFGAKSLISLRLTGVASASPQLAPATAKLLISLRPSFASPHPPYYVRGRGALRPSPSFSPRWR